MELEWIESHWDGSTILDGMGTPHFLSQPSHSPSAASANDRIWIVIYVNTKQTEPSTIIISLPSISCHSLSNRRSGTNLTCEWGRGRGGVGMKYGWSWDGVGMGLGLSRDGA